MATTTTTTRRAALAGIGDADAPTAHAGLWMDRYPQNVSREDKLWKRGLVEATARKEASGEGMDYARFYSRWRQTLDCYGARFRVAEVEGRMIVGLGAEGVLETSIALQRTYGVPYIPGSALKGLARRGAGKLDDDWTAEHSRVVFGNDNRDADDAAAAGYVTFFDALYVPGSSRFGRALQADVLTVHHAEYYMTDDAPPADWDDPKPVPFLSATGSYLVALYCEYEEWVAPTFALLEYALREIGVGAKTSSGYGRMTLTQ